MLRVLPQYRVEVAGSGDQEVVEAFPAQCSDESFRDRVRAGLTGQSKIILWITRGLCVQLPVFAACAFQVAKLFLVAADARGDGFEAAAQLVDLDGQPGQGGGLAPAGAVLVDGGAQRVPPVEGGAADARAGGHVPEGDGLPGGGQLGAGGLDPGQVVVVSWHWPG